MPRCEDLPYLRPSVRLSLLPTFELHALLGECHFFFGQVERFRDLGKIR
jgi:hypothetical protein